IIRPPGAGPEEEFLQKCVRCGECMRVCPTNGLQPMGLEGGLEALWTPWLVPRVGQCDYQCTLCGRVCPSGAIRPLTIDAKHEISIGKARFDRNRCIPWVGYARLSELKARWEDVNCAVCEEVCPVPTKAIRFNTFKLDAKREIRRPFVIEDLCIGCGYCEKVCPVAGEAAVRVEGRRGKIELPEEAPVPDIGQLFPKQVGRWRLLGKPTVYVGAKGLFEYIDGGAPPYLTFAFRWAAVAEYGDSGGQDKVKVDAWQFESSDGAFGAFATDAYGNPIDGVADRAFRYENYVWAWRGRYSLKGEPREGTPSAEAVTAFVRAVARNIPGPVTMPPSLVRRLPAEGLVAASVKFFHDKIILDNLYLAGEPIEENVFRLGRGIDAVAAEYKFPQGRGYRMLLIRYPSRQQAAQVARDFARYRETQWGEKSER
ncbi:MAG TPA: 4Fe-4S dicluster domain-containing protein, partial [Planctomycetaceae bacterium]|nr:4Fe-4S dicluster domain-containing protein [Planctomycetaceae bacterium]